MLDISCVLQSSISVLAILRSNSVIFQPVLLDLATWPAVLSSQSMNVQASPASEYDAPNPSRVALTAGSCVVSAALIFLECQCPCQCRSGSAVSVMSSRPERQPMTVACQEVSVDVTLNATDELGETREASMSRSVQNQIQ
jgi:hypothetical protein